METLDTFSCTFLPATALAKLSSITIRRHVQVLRGCAGDRDSVAVVARCTSRAARRSMLMLTRNRLVITTESPLLRRVSLHLNADLHQLADVTWTPEPGRTGIQLGVTAIDGVRENMWVHLPNKAEIWRLDEALKQAFRTPRGLVAAATTPTATHSAKPILRFA